jgi:hypothetical protein
MIDTLKLRLIDYDIKNNSKLIIQPSTKDLQGNENNNHILHRNSSGLEIEGSKAYLNTEHFNLNLGCGQSNSSACYVQTSIPKLANGKNYSPVDFMGLKTAIHTLEQHLKDNGIYTNLEQAKLSRLDLFVNVNAEYDFMNYSPVYRQLGLNRQNRQTDYGTTFLYGNRQIQLCVYDKRTEMLNREEDVSGLPITIRHELRLLKARKIKNDIGINNVAELFGAYDYLPEYYKTYVLNNFYKYDVFEGSAQTDKLRAAIEIIQRQYGTNGVTAAKLRNQLGLFAIAELSEQDYEYLKQVGSNRMFAQRVKVLVNRAKPYLMQHTRIFNKVTLSDLYNELRNKILAA